MRFVMIYFWNLFVLGILHNLSKIIRKHYLHILICVGISLLIITESRIPLSYLFANTGGVRYGSIDTHAMQGSGVIVWEALTASLVIFLIKNLELPYYTEILFFVILRLIGAVMMYFFVYKFIWTFFEYDNRRVKMIIALIGCLTFLHYPYYVIGDNFPEAVLYRFLTPVYLVSLLYFLNSRRTTFFVLTSAIFAYMLVNDPRVLFYIGIPSFFILVFPKILQTSTSRNKIMILGLFSSIILLGVLISSYYIFPRFGSEGFPTSVHIPLVKDSFRYDYADFSNAIRGLAFEGTNIQYNQIGDVQSDANHNINSYGLFIIPLFALLGISLVIMSAQIRKIAIIFPPLILTVLVLVIFSSLGDREPLIVQLVFATDLTSNNVDWLTKLLTIFRTPRMMDNALAMSYSLLVPITLVLVHQLFSKKRYKVVRFLFFGFASFSIISVSFPFLLGGQVFSTGMTQLIDDRARAYEKIRQIIGDDIGYRKAVSIPYSDTNWSFPQPWVGHGHSILRYYYEYAMDPDVKTSLLSRGLDKEFADAIRWFGIKYLIVDEYASDRSYVKNFLSNNHDFSLIHQIGKLSVYQIRDSFDLVGGAQSAIVLGGYETYRNTLPSISRNGIIAPIFLDGPVSENTLGTLSGPILASPEKTEIDLAATYLVNDDKTVLVRPYNFVRDTNPELAWSPADITDSHHSVFSWYFPQWDGFQWEYTTRPDYGIAYTSANDSLSLPFSISTEDSYNILARVLLKDDESSISVKVDDGSLITINTSAPSYFKSDAFKNRVEFTWVNIGKFYLSKGNHTLEITNENGINGINLFAISPATSVANAMERSDHLVRSLGTITVLDNYSGKQIDHIDMNVLTAGEYTIVLRNPSLRDNVTLVTLDGIHKGVEYEDQGVIQFDNIYLQKGYQSVGILKVDDLEPIFESSFEKGSIDTTWSEPSKAFDAEIDDPSEYRNNSSLKIISESTTPDWSWVYSPLIPTESGEIYLIQTDMKWQNTESPHIAIDYSTQDNDDLFIRLKSMPYSNEESSDWKTFRTTVHVPDDAKFLRIALNAGWMEDRGPAITWFDNIAVQKVRSNITTDTVVLYGPKGTISEEYFEEKSKSLHSIDIKKETIIPLGYDYNEYKVSLSMNNEGILVIPEKFSGTYKINIDNQAKDIDYTTFPVFNVFTGFKIASKEGSVTSLDITIYDEGKRLYYYLSFIIPLILTSIIIILVSTDILSRKYRALFRFTRL